MAPGGGEIGVVDFIAGRLPGLPGVQALLARLDDARFLDRGQEERLRALSECGDDPAFEQLRREVIYGLFADARHGGNRNDSGWELLGYPGPRQLWTEQDQQIRLLGWTERVDG
jgi:hypothetical protein